MVKTARRMLKLNYEIEAKIARFVLGRTRNYPALVIIVRILGSVKEEILGQMNDMMDNSRLENCGMDGFVEFAAPMVWPKIGRLASRNHTLEYFTGFLTNAGVRGVAAPHFASLTC